MLFEEYGYLGDGIWSFSSTGGSFPGHIPLLDPELVSKIQFVSILNSKCRMCPHFHMHILFCWTDQKPENIWEPLIYVSLWLRNTLEIFKIDKQLKLI